MVKLADDMQPEDLRLPVVMQPPDPDGRKPRNPGRMRGLVPGAGVKERRNLKQEPAGSPYCIQYSLLEASLELVGHPTHSPLYASTKAGRSGPVDLPASRSARASWRSVSNRALSNPLVATMVALKLPSRL
eukprot:3941131-Rhodomonas_salina.1